MVKNVSYDYKTALRYFAFGAGFIFFSFAGGDFQPYSLALLFALLFAGYSLIITPTLFVLPYIFSFDYHLILFSAVAAVLLGCVFFVYRKKDVKMKAESVFYIACALIAYVLFSKDGFENILERLFSSLLTLVLSFITLNIVMAVLKKGLKFKPSADQLLSGGVLLAVLGMGVINLLGVNAWKLLAVFSILLTCYLFGGGRSACFSAAFALPVCIIAENLEMMGVFLIWSLASMAFMGISRYLSPLALVLTDILMSYIFSVYPFGFVSAAFVCGGALLFALLPLNLLALMKDKLSVFKEKHLARMTINRNRLMLSSRLLQISSVFREMETVFSGMSGHLIDEDNAVNILTEEAVGGVCRVCNNKDKCITRGGMRETDVKKIVRIGMTKGKVTVLDMPGELAKACVFPNNFLFTVNKSLGGYRNYILENGNMKNGRELIGAQAGGIADILYQIAVETNSKLSFDAKLEKHLISELANNGIFVKELLCFYGGDRGELNISVLAEEGVLEDKKMSSVITKAVGQRMTAVQKTVLDNELISIVFKPAPKYDAVFGIAGKTKEGSDMSGDTHSLLRLCEDKFMIAVSDGMGSGERAKNVSDSAITLIESFYKAGLESGLILETVNKLLSINSEETFSAIDICVVNLKDGRTDFIKIGAPYGFVIKDGGVAIIEGNSLPLGILNDIKPQVTTDILNPGDMVILLSDGVTDAFSSSSDLLDFIQNLTAKNPQTLADEVLKEAAARIKGSAGDDMTVLALRMFEK